MRDERLAAEFEGPDPLADVPAQFLSARGLAVRLLRLMNEHRRAGTDPEAILGLVWLQCEGAAAMAPAPDEEDADGR